MRVFALRVLIGWWIIPFIWTIFWPIAYLLGGTEEANYITKELTKYYWYGV